MIEKVKMLWSMTLIKAVVLVILMVAILKLLDLVFRVKKKKGGLHVSFFKGVLQALTVIFFLFQIGSLSDTMARFYNSILMSSSLLVVVLGFVFQEGLSNIVHGFILTFFKPFDIGDRVNVTIDGVQITGYIQSINLRNTIIKNVYNNSSVIVPNAKMDLCVIDNSYFDESADNSNFLDVEITYESDLDKACELISAVIDEHALVQKAKKNADARTSVLVSQLGSDGITLRASVVTSTIEENFTACSDIRKELIRRFKAEPDLDFAYPHTVVVPFAQTEDTAE